MHDLPAPALPRPGVFRLVRGPRRPPGMTVGLLVIVIVLGSAILGTLWTPYDPNQPDFRVRLIGPTAAHPLGTDHFGRDLLSRIMAGAANALLVGAVAVGVAFTFGGLIGVAAGFAGGWLDEALMRPSDALSAFPPILLALLGAAIIGPGWFSSMLAIGLANVPAFARVARGSTLAVRGLEYVESARALGATRARIVWRHLVPNILAPQLVLATVAFATAILAEAALSYLGLGTQPPTASWGRMLREAQTFIALSPFPTIFPGLAIVFTVLGWNLFGDGLRDLLDPRTR